MYDPNDGWWDYGHARQLSITMWPIILLFFFLYGHGELRADPCDGNQWIFPVWFNLHKLQDIVNLQFDGRSSC